MSEPPTLYDIREDETRPATQADLDALMNKAATEEIRKRLLGRILYMDAAELIAERDRIAGKKGYYRTDITQFQGTVSASAP